MIDSAGLLADLQHLLPVLEQDILDYNAGQVDLEDGLPAEYRAARETGRTAEPFGDRRAALVKRAALDWVLTCVFVRFLEDNLLLPEPWLTGPGTRRQDAGDRAAAYFHAHPDHTERDYLLAAFQSVADLPARGGLPDRRHGLSWRLPLSADGARHLLGFFQRRDPGSGDLVHDFTDPDGDTRFLGDLYQDLSGRMREACAQVQTPEFVVSFILDYTLTPALDQVGLARVRLIDPACGSGQFLLGAFARLFAAWQRREPATAAGELARRALGAVYGVDLDPCALSIARFRLLIAALGAAGCQRLQQAPDFRCDLAVGDSLLQGRRFEWQGQGIQADLLDAPVRQAPGVEESVLLGRVLGQRYTVVVGDPPDITVKDRVLNRACRSRYPTCHRRYSLAVPFTERFFDLALPAGFVGMITASGFTQAEFGRKLVQEYLPRKDLTHVIDLSGACIPGYGGSAVILFARNRRPVGADLRAVLGIRGEPGVPEDAARGLVWRSIVERVERPGSGNEYVSVADQDRGVYGKHPWRLGGGRAAELKVLIESGGGPTLEDRIADVGRSARSAEDAVLSVSLAVAGTYGLRGSVVPMVEGGQVRDWEVMPGPWALVTGDPATGGAPEKASGALARYVWAVRGAPGDRKASGQGPLLSPRGFVASPAITCARLASHNHFALDGGGKLFRQSAPVIRLPQGAGEADYLALLGLLNSSTACFWMRQVLPGKGSRATRAAPGTEAWELRHEYTGSGLAGFPLPIPEHPGTLALARVLHTLARRLAAQSPAAVLAAWTPDRPLSDVLAEAEGRENALWQQMIARQEELDWHCYRLYGLTDQDLCYPDNPPGIRLGQRPFEIRLARRMAAGEVETTWFERHASTPITETPADWPADYRSLAGRRLASTEANRWIALVEQPEYKRRWHREPWASRQRQALRQWLLDHLASCCHDPALITCAQLADRERHDPGFRQVVVLYAGEPDCDPRRLVSELVAEDQVPQMAACRYRRKALPKFRAWQATWASRRREDAVDGCSALDPAHLSEAQAGALEAGPPEYAGADFLEPGYWSLRGRLDVPRERFFSLPHCERDGDATQVVGWAGLDHLQRARAIADWYLVCKQQDGWDGGRLTPLLVALDELLPWLEQWHNAPDPENGERMGDWYEAFLLAELRQLGIPRNSLADWRPPAATRGRKARTP